MRLALRTVALVSFVVVGFNTVAACARSAPRVDPAAAAAELLAADRAFSAASVETDLVSGVSAAFADDVVIPGPGPTFTEGKAAAIALLQRDSLNATSRATWTPVRAGVSGDGTHGFTIGFIDVVRADGTPVPGQYLAYWIKGDAGWRVAVYRRGRRDAGAVDSAFAGFVLPTAPGAARDDAQRAADLASLIKAESDFSDLATAIGLGPAFERTGDPLATHLSGGPQEPDLIRGNVAIARSVSAGLAPGANPYVWATDFRAVVAPSGDLGVSIGYIQIKERAPDGSARAPIPFFTVWRRAGLDAPWRYIAE